MSTVKVDRRVDHSHHFESMEQEHESGKQGTWLFMATEVMMFGALFTAYFMYRGKYYESWVEGGDLLSWKMGALNTIVLLFSSFTMALAVRETQLGNNKKALKHVIFTTVCAFAFLVVKYFEYTSKFDAGLFPSVELWTYDAQTPQLRLFMVVYFIMTGLHGIHILIGIGLMFWLMKRLKNEEFSKDYYTAVEGVGLYWHIVDLIWIYLFPLMYLI